MGGDDNSFLLILSSLPITERITTMSRSINAKELTELSKYHRSQGDELLALAYEQEEEDLQREMNRD